MKLFIQPIILSLLFLNACGSGSKSDSPKEQKKVEEVSTVSPKKSTPLTKPKIDDAIPQPDPATEEPAEEKEHYVIEENVAIFPQTFCDGNKAYKDNYLEEEYAEKDYICQLKEHSSCDKYTAKLCLKDGEEVDAASIYPEAFFKVLKIERNPNTNHTQRTEMQCQCPAL